MFIKAESMDTPRGFLPDEVNQLSNVGCVLFNKLPVEIYKTNSFSFRGCGNSQIACNLIGSIDILADVIIWQYNFIFCHRNMNFDNLNVIPKTRIFMKRERERSECS